MTADKVYLIRQFDSNDECEDFLCENSESYEPINITETSDHITVLLKFKGLAK